ncbi:MAG: hypothetical protein ACO3GK_05070 [Bacteroidia bacterium]
MRKYLAFAAFTGLAFGSTWAQVDSLATEEEEDYSLYDNVSFADAGTKAYCTNKIEGLSPSKLISVGYDYQLGYNLTSINTPGGQVQDVYEQADFARSNGMRLALNVPVISRNDLIVQLGANYWNQGYSLENEGIDNPIAAGLAANGLRTTGMNLTVFKPFDETRFFLFQGSGDLNGDYSFSDIMPLKYTKYSAAALYGKRVSDRKMWGWGLARTYRVGELNYIPILLYNSTNLANTWGTEVLFPARAHVRRTFNPRSMLFMGYELEGNSYRMYRSSVPQNDLEIRRGELRFRFVYERSLKDFIWLSAQVGYRYNYSFDADVLPEGQEFFRGFFGDQPLAMEQSLTNPLYFNISLNLVSP